MSKQIEILSAGLYRPLQSGKYYDKYIKGTSCKVTSLKEGDTFTTVQHMYNWVQKHLHHTVDLSPLLKGNSLADTANKIYRFLYSHIQYKADGAMQNLLSPGCTWATRKTGADCKTFSIFASSILTNLGIQHSIRQVTQPGYYPNEFTHVYVVIPENQKLKKLNDEKVIVIDATRHENTEVQFIKKHDTLMLHQGLSSPAPSKALCSFAGRNLRTGGNAAMRSSAGKKLTHCRGLNGAVAVSTLARDLTDLANVLIMAGVPQSQMQIVVDEAVKYLEAGKEPNFGINQMGITVGSKFIPFSPIGLQSPGLGLAPLAVGLISSMAAAGGAAAGGVGSLMGPLSDILGKLNIGENIKLVSKYGLSSWGASGSPEKAEAEFMEFTAPKLNELVNKIKPDDNLGNSLTNIAVYLDAWGNYAKFANKPKAKSSQMANEWRYTHSQDLKRKIIDPIINDLRSAGIIVKIDNVPMANYNFRVQYLSDRVVQKGSSNFDPNTTYTQKYSIEVPASLLPSINTPANVPTTTGGNTNYPTTQTPAYGGNTNYPTTTGGNTNYPTTAGGYSQVTGQMQNTQQNAGGGMLPMLLIGGAVTGLIYTQMNKKKAATPSKTKK